MTEKEEKKYTEGDLETMAYYGSGLAMAGAGLAGLIGLSLIGPGGIEGFLFMVGIGGCFFLGVGLWRFNQWKKKQ